MGREVRYAARRLAQSPAFTIASILTLALAIGANTSIFAVIWKLAIRHLPESCSLVSPSTSIDRNL